jgi:hypothetical protein
MQKGETMKTKTMIFFLLLGVCAQSLVASCSLSQTNASGDVFIVTKGGENFKLGLVNVAVFSDTSIQPFIQTKLQTETTELVRLNTILDKLDNEATELGNEKQAWPKKVNNKIVQNWTDRSMAIYKEEEQVHEELGPHLRGSFLFSDLPSATATTKTDANGKFILNLEPGKYVLAASASRMVGDTTEKYYWFISIAVDSIQQKRIMLSNDNLFKAHSTDNAIDSSEFWKLFELLGRR